MPRTHDRTHFFKYASFETAVRVIESKSFRWSSPTTFNDPFDHQTGIALEWDRDKFAKELTTSIERVVFFDRIIPVVPSSLLAALTLQFRSIRESLPRRQFLQQMHEASIETAAKIYSGGMDQLNADLQKQLCHSRVLCVTELHDNVVMWSHYADEHRGVVFKLGCIDEIDNSLLVARKVSYAQTSPPFPSADEYARHLTGEKPIDLLPFFLNVAFMKHPDWAYEKEWRVHAPLQQKDPGDGYTFYQEKPQIFEAIYLGCRMHNNEVGAIVKLISRNLPTTKIFRGKKSNSGFTLSFTEMQ